MTNKKENIRKFVKYLNNIEAEGGGLWLPDIQRSFVWDTDQIGSLFDSIMREYPISTLLIWKTKEKIKHRKFIDVYNPNFKLRDFYVPMNDKQKLLVLDGQQRLQSLFIGLMGSYDGKELYFDLLSGLKLSQNNIKYDFKFLNASDAEAQWIKIKDIVFSNKQYDDLSEELIQKLESSIELSQAQKKLIRNNVSRIVKVFKTDDYVNYQEIDSIDNPELYNHDDVVEIFIRANAGGTKLEKSDLLFSLLVSGWDKAEEEIEILKEELNTQGYDFSRDFILKTCLTLIGAGAKYDVQKFRNKENLKKIESNWKNISDAIRDVKDFIFSNTFIKSDAALPSYSGLIPIIYFRYFFKKKWDEKNAGLNKWFLRILLTGAFSGSPDNLIDQCNRKISEVGNFDVVQINEIIKNAGRSLEVTEDTILQCFYGDKYLYLLFNLWYGHFDFNFVPSYINNAPQIDHIFPQSLLKEVKYRNPETGRFLIKYLERDRNQIANCMLLTAKENGAGGKGDTPSDKWFKDKDEKYLEMHLIPKDATLWKMENYEKFIEERKKLLVKSFKEIINI